MSRLLLYFAAAVAFAADRPAFDIADVHVSPRAEWVKSKLLQGGYLAGDRYELHRATMVDLIRLAYNVDADKVYGGPNWLDYDRYEIVAKTKPGTRPETLRLMLQSLIEDRFKVAVKMDTRDVPGYILSKGKGELKVRPTETASPGGCQLSGRPPSDDHTIYLDTKCRNVTMAAFAQALRPRLSAPLVNFPVLDSTGIEGGWDIDFQVGTPIAAISTTSQSALVIEALAGLGFKLELGKIPQPVLVVENANQQPSPNVSDIAEKLPPLPPSTFEVASIKWPCESDHSESLRFDTGGRVTSICQALEILIGQAWGLPLWVKPAGLPKWLADDSSKYNISIFAKSPANVAADPKNNQQARDVLNAMLRELLIDRYRMKVHFEDRPMDAYTLAAVKPKLAKADPDGRTGCTRESQQQQGRATIVRLACRNMTMAQFAEEMQTYDSAQIAYPVLDATGIQGARDFTLNYDVMAGLNAHLPPIFAAARANASPDAPAAEPVGTLSLMDAIEKQLGLKLEMHKRPVPVLVIDHMEEKPIEN
jgi:uncharacterized protein (TIGR03435 family)